MLRVLYIIGVVLLCRCTCMAQQFKAGKVQLSVVQQQGLRKGKGFSAFGLDNHFVWGASVIRAKEDGRYYLFYAAMEAGPDCPKFNDAWTMGSKIGVAVSENPEGGFRNLGFV